MTHYIKATRMWDLEDTILGDVELQVEPRPDEEDYSNEEHTALQMFDTETGDALSGQVILDREQLTALQAAINACLAALDN